METKIANLIMFAMTAGMTAVTLIFVMHDGLGLSRAIIRFDALLSAVVTGTFLVVLLKFPTTK